MNLSEIKKYLNCKSLTNEKLLDRDIRYCFASDLMSDVLRFARTNCLLLTGITNNQVIQVSEILDLTGIIFVRGKLPDEEVVKLAEEKKLPLLSTENLLFDTCGKLYGYGLRGGKSRLMKENASEENVHPII